MENIIVEKVTKVSGEVLEALNSFLPHLISDPRTLTEADLQNMIDATGNRLFVAKDKESGKIIGTITVIVYEIPLYKKAVFEDLVIDESYRGKGIGTLLLKKGIEQARQEEVLYVSLTSKPQRETANKLYQNLGFKKMETNVYRLYFKHE